MPAAEERYDQKRIEREVLEYWAGRGIPERIVRFGSGRKKFYLLDGPPYVNGTPHVGHVKTTTFKDVWGKFKTMQGFSVWYQPGFDCSGLPIENAVEKRLGIKSKKDIEGKIGISSFINECRKLAERNLSAWMELYRKLAAWRGWAEPYLTYKNYYLESGWWTLKKLHEKGLLVRGRRPGFWCPRCETTLSGYEVTDSYKNMEDPSIYVKFPVKGGKNDFLLVWTTTPWTLPANVAIAVHPDERYVKARVWDFTLILAKKRLEALHTIGVGYRVLEEFPGKRLEGIRYLPVLDVPLQKELQRDPNAHRVVLSVPLMKRRVASKVAEKRGSRALEEFGHIVDMETGSGLVHIAPGHGDADNQLGKHYNLPEPSPVDDAGKLTEEAGYLAGLYVKKADRVILGKLNESGRLLHYEKITHSYPLCWRCKDPLIYRMSSQWYLKLDSVREGIIRESRSVKWLPGFASERFRNLMLEAPDWAITRQRYWGIPLPIWVCGRCDSLKVIGSAEEMRKESVTRLPPNIDLHKDTVDRVEFRCRCGGSMKRLPDIMDVWFDSGIAPWASVGYPFMNRSLFRKLWPADLVDESQDQVRGWFYTLMLSGYSVFGRKPFRTVCLNGWTLDEKGEKMSKSVGNVIMAEEAHRELGSDVLRLYYCHDTPPWETQRFSLRQAGDLKRVMSVLWNTHAFIRTYAAPVRAAPGHLLPEDRWILSRVNTLARELTKDLEEFRFHLAGRSLTDFILNDLSRWYVKLVRGRLSPWNEGRDRAAASWTLRHVLEKLLRLMAPVSPLISERIYTQAFGRESVHLQRWPGADSRRIDRNLEKGMEVARGLVEAINSARQEQGIRLKWPVSEVFVRLDDSRLERRISPLEGVVRLMGNVKQVNYTEKAPRGAVRFGQGRLSLGRVLEGEAFVRELIRSVQVLRKKRGLDVRQRIELFLSSDPGTEALLKGFEKDILKGTGSRSMALSGFSGRRVTETIMGKKVAMGFRA